MKKFYTFLLVIASTTFTMEMEEHSHTKQNHEKTIEWLSTIPESKDWAFENNIINLSTQDENGNTLLHALAQKGDQKLFRILGNKISSQEKELKNSDNKTPVDIIHENIEKLIHSPDNPDNSKLESFKKCKYWLDSNVGPKFPEHYYKALSSLDTLEKALENNLIQFYIYDDQGNTYLHYVCANTDFNKITTILKYVPKKVYYKKNRDGDTPLQILKQRTENLYTEGNQKKLKEGIKFLNFFRKTQLKIEKEPSIECFCGDIQYLKGALATGVVKLSAKNPRGETLLHQLAKAGKYEELKHIEKYIEASDLSQKNKGGLIPEQIAEIRYREAISNFSKEEIVKKYDETLTVLKERKELVDDCTII